MRIEVGEAHLGGGDIDASVVAVMKDGVLSGTASLKADDIPAAAVAGLLGLSGVTGTAAGSADLASSGATWGDLAAGLSGSGSVNIADGSVGGVDLTLLPQMIADPASNPAGGTTAFGLATATLALAQGTLSTDDL